MNMHKNARLTPRGRERIAPQSGRGSRTFGSGKLPKKSVGESFLGEKVLWGGSFRGV
jgi:hypothetical protein